MSPRQLCILYRVHQGFGTIDLFGLGRIVIVVPEPKGEEAMALIGEVSWRSLTATDYNFGQY